MTLSRKHILKIIFIVWVVLWVNFIFRDLFYKGEIKTYKTLLGRNWDGKRSFVYGDDFYLFLVNAYNNMPLGIKYKLTGIEPLSLEHRRAVYYLYPNLESENPDYVLVYNSEYQDPEYVRYKELGKNRYILKRK